MSIPFSYMMLYMYFLNHIDNCGAASAGFMLMFFIVSALVIHMGKALGYTVSVSSCILVLFILLLPGIILVPGYMRARSQGQLTSCKLNLKNIGNALELYSADNLGRYSKSLTALTPRYLQVLPFCPVGNHREYKYTVSQNPDIYTVYCSGSYHSPLTDDDFPEYDAVEGLYEVNRKPSEGR